MSNNMQLTDILKIQMYAKGLCNSSFTVVLKMFFSGCYDLNLTGWFY